MPTVIGHAVSGLAVDSLFSRKYSPRTAVVCALCASAPDLDAIGFRFGIPYGHWLGHRGFTHGVLFAVLLGSILSVLMTDAGGGARRLRLAAAFFISAVSHDLLDAVTDGGLGVAFISPISNTRYFLPWRPIEVSPLSTAGLFSARGLRVLRSELVWVVLPSLLIVVAVQLYGAASTALSGKWPRGRP